ncbi:MAG TPA: hypothetical protein VFV34_22980, partial [Blastocatellia bacterium]|nr:hypothetical protein [Blastocatellia bacterium]
KEKRIMKPIGISSLLLPGLKRLPALASLLSVLSLAAGTVCLAQTPAAADGWVVLPVNDYRALRDAAFPSERDPEPPPVDATLTRVDYDLKVDGDLASGEARLAIDVIKEGWVRVAIPAGLMVREAKLDGKPVSLVSQPTAEKGSGASYVLLSRTGRASLTLAIVAPVSSVAGTEMLQLPASSSAVSRALVTLPRQGVDVRITGGLLLEKSETANGSRFVAHGRGYEGLTFAWRRKVDDQRVTQPLRFRGSLTQLVGLGEDTTQITAEVQVDVQQGVAKEIRLQLPPQFTVNQVAGAMVADWETAAQEIVVTMVEPVERTTRFTVIGEVRLPRDGKIDVPLMRLAAAERESGAVAVEVLGAGEIKERQATGMEEAEAADLGQLIASRQSPLMVGFRMRNADGKSPRSLSVRVARYTPQAVLTANVEEAQYNVLITDDGKMLVQSRFAVRNNQRNFLKVTLPADAVLWSASVAGRPIRPGSAPDKSLLIPLEKTRTGEEAPAFAVEIAYLDHVPAWTDRGRSRLTLPALDMPISKSGLLVHHSPLFRLTPAQGSFRTATYSPPTSAALQTGSPAIAAAPMPVPASMTKKPSDDAAQALVAQLQQSGRASRPGRNLPIRIAFPHYGPSLFFVSELTSENQAPVLEVDFQRERKRGER